MGKAYFRTVVFAVYQFPQGNSMGQLPSHLRPPYSLVQPNQLACNRRVPLRYGFDDRLP
jgi:hypothetical protein